jgi:hypothetical protein
VKYPGAFETKFRPSLSNTKTGENRTEEVIGTYGPGNFSQMTKGSAQMGRQ